MKQTTKKPEHQIFSLRVRLVVLVAIELVASVFLAVWISNLLDRYIPASWDVPFLLYLVVPFRRRFGDGVFVQTVF